MMASPFDTSDFKLRDDLVSAKHAVVDLKLCKVLLYDDCTWHWLVLVPMRNGAVENICNKCVCLRVLFRIKIPDFFG